MPIFQHKKRCSVYSLVSLSLLWQWMRKGDVLQHISSSVGPTCKQIPSLGSRGSSLFPFHFETWFWWQWLKLKLLEDRMFSCASWFTSPHWHISYSFRSHKRSWLLLAMIFSEIWQQVMLAGSLIRWHLPELRDLACQVAHKVTKFNAALDQIEAGHCRMWYFQTSVTIHYHVQCAN